MARKTWAFGAIALALAGATLVPAQAQQHLPPLSFTIAQAAHGQQVYQASCQACHGADLGGGPGGPPLMGAAFRSQWRTQSGEALFNYIRQKMPPNSGGSLDESAYADVTARILQANGVTPGEMALRPDPAKLAKLSFAAAMPPDAEIKLGPIPQMPTFVPDSTTTAALSRRSERLRNLRAVTDDMLRNPPSGEWLHWRNTYDAHGFSRLDQVNLGNVGRLQQAWSWELGAGPNEITPLMHDGVLFIESGGRLQALDAASGDLLWQYVRPDAGGVVRNLAIYGDLIYFAANTDMVALDIRDGHVVWDKALATANDGINVSSGPLAAKGKIFQGMSGCDKPYPGGCFIVALDALTGQEVWRFHTIARPGQPGGDSWNGAPVDRRFGGSVWSAPSYDPDLDLLFFGTAQTYQTTTLLQGGTGQPGSADALYTDSTLALRPDTGELAWFHQHMARDVWDMDWAFEHTLATISVNGAPRRTVTTSGKLSIFETLDAATGRFLSANDLGLQTLVSAVDPNTGAKTVAPRFKPEPNVLKTICPSTLGGKNWMATAFNPDTGILFVPLNDDCMLFRWSPGSTFDIAPFAIARPNSDGNIGRVEAVDLASHKTLWVRRERSPESSAILATAGGLIFEGSNDRWFRASDQRTGKVLWQVRLNGPISSFPITYTVDGVQYVAVTAGGGGPLETVMGMLAPELSTPSSGTTLWVFRLAPS